MANTIALAKNYTSILDEVYCGASVTADLTSDNSMVRNTGVANPKETEAYDQIKIFLVDADGITPLTYANTELHD